MVFADEKRLRGLDNLDVIKVSVRDESNQYVSFEDFITNFSSEWPKKFLNMIMQLYFTHLDLLGTKVFYALIEI